jgi:hypothetical protein
MASEAIVAVVAVVFTGQLQVVVGAGGLSVAEADWRVEPSCAAAPIWTSRDVLNVLPNHCANW